MSGSSSPTSFGFSLPNMGDTQAALLGGALGGVGGALLGGVGNSVANALKPPNPNLQSPDALSSTPTQGTANTTALQNQLQQESLASSTSNYFSSGGASLMEPTTTSRVLLGS